MKNSNFLIIILAIALVVISYKWATSTGKPDASEDEPSVNAAIENIMTRTSVRAYSNRQITDQQLDTIMRAAMAAPSAVNKQPWRFIVVKNQSLRDSISQNMGSMKMAKDAPVSIIVCGDMEATLEGEGQPYWVQDLSAVSENILLAANALGIGSVWCGIYPIAKRVEWFQKTFNIPQQIIPLACINLGYPAEQPTPKDKWKPENIHYETWN